MDSLPEVGDVVRWSNTMDLHIKNILGHGPFIVTEIESTIIFRVKNLDSSQVKGVTGRDYLRLIPNEVTRDEFLTAVKGAHGNR